VRGKKTVVTKKGEAPLRTKIAVVGREGDACWYEATAANANGRTMIVKAGDEPAMEIPVGMMALQPSTGPARPGKANVVDKGTASITVPAGVLRAQRLQYQDADGVVDIWIHRDVFPYGVVNPPRRTPRWCSSATGPGPGVRSPRPLERSRCPGSRRRPSGGARRR